MPNAQWKWQTDLQLRSSVIREIASNWGTNYR